MNIKGIPYGASYSPLIFPEDQWEQDLQLMVGAAMNLVRIGDVHGSWDRIEPRPGEFAFGVLERFYHTAAKHGIHILLSNGAACPPLWLKTQFPDVSILSSRGERYPLGSSYHWACIHHPGYLEALETYTLRLAEFAAGFSNHFGWQISNEIGFPFLPAREGGELGLYCYCEHCQSKFREWIKQKYKTLEALTTAWSWGTTNFVYNHWQEVLGPEALPDSWSGVTRWIDWRLFWQDAFASFAGWQHRLIRSIDPDHPTSINTFNFKGYDRFGTFMGLDQWKIAPEVDHIGYDLYPGSGDKLKTRPEHNSIFLDHGRSVSRTTGKTFWLHEVESGPIGGWLLGPEHNTRPQDLENYIFESLGHDGKLIIYMPWREWGYQPLRWGALVSLKGKPTPRLEAARRLGKFITQQSEFLTNARVAQGEVALLESKPNAIFLRGINQEELLFQAQRGAYRAFWDRGYAVDFITPAQLSNPELTNYQAICMPLLGLLDEEHTLLLEKYVRDGGVLIGTSRLATQDQKGWYYEDMPLPSFQRLFGIERIEADTLDDQQILYKNVQFPAAINRDLITPKQDTEILANFSDGVPAVTRATLGKGFGVYIGTQADVAYVNKSESKLLGELVPALMPRSPRMEVVGEFGRPEGIDPHVLDTDQKTFIIFSNYLSEEQSGTFNLDLQDRQPTEVGIIYPTRSSLTYQAQDGRLSIPLKFGIKEVVCLEINWM